MIFRRELRKLDEAGLIDGLKDVNQSVAELVVGWAQSLASTKMEKKAAATLKASTNVQARSQVTFGGAKAAIRRGRRVWRQCARSLRNDAHAARSVHRVEPI
jgi:hypothetical protein